MPKLRESVIIELKMIRRHLQFIDSCIETIQNEGQNIMKEDADQLRTDLEIYLSDILGKVKNLPESLTVPESPFSIPHYRPEGKTWK